MEWGKQYHTTHGVHNSKPAASVNQYLSDSSLRQVEFPLLEVPPSGGVPAYNEGMTVSPEHEAFLKKLADPHYYGEQDENGVDLSLIRENLKLSPLERLRKMNRISQSLESLRQRVGRIQNHTP
jgi:hypothetical protein